MPELGEMVKLATISITAPSSAKKGASVPVSVKVTNNTAYNYSYKATIYAVPDLYPDFTIGSIDQVITSGSSVTRSASFTMPDCNTTVFVWVERWAATYWAYDSSASKVVSFEVPVPTYPATDIKNIAIIVRGPAGPTYPATDLRNIAIIVRGPAYPATDLRNVAIIVRGPLYPATDLKNIAIVVKGPAYPPTDIKSIAISVVGVEYPSTDLKNITIRVIPVGYIPPLAEGFVKIEITKPLPSSGVFGITYKIEGSAKMFDIIGALPWLYAEVKKKEWYLPEIIEEVSYERGFPIPITGDFTIDFKPEKGGDYEVTIVATPAPLPLPVVGVFPTVGKSGMMKIKVE